ncbi:MAG: V-type ATP synthase subunit E [Hominenteromicrobium sp.]
MATGLDRILEQIRTDAEEKAAAEIAAAEHDAELTLARAAEQAEEKAAAVCAQGEAQDADIRAKAQSAAEFSRRRTVLAAKQNAIRETIAAARERLHSLPDGEYFAVLLKLAQKNAADGDAELRLNAKDLARMPRDFEKQLCAAVTRGHITVSKTPCDIADGFLLVYGGIDVNCTFDSLFEAEADALQDLAGGMLFR